MPDYIFHRHGKAMPEVVQNDSSPPSKSALFDGTLHLFWTTSGRNDCLARNFVSVDYIEQMTGFDLFANLPGDNNSGIEKATEANTSWTAFLNF